MKSKASSNMKLIVADGQARSPEKKKHAGGAPRKRPYCTDPGVVERICEGLIAGQSLPTVCDDDETLPDSRSVWYELARNPYSEFSVNIARARAAQQDAVAEDIIRMADAATEDDYNVVKLRIWVRQWRASKLAPKKYGEKVYIDNRIQSVNINLTQNEYEDVGRKLIEEN